MGSFSEFTYTLDRVRETSGKNEKVRLLSEYMRGLDAEDAELAARFATGRSSVKGSADETQIGYSTIMGVLEGLTGLSGREVGRVYVKYGDLGRVVEEILSAKKETTLFEETLTLKEVAQSFEAMTRAKGKGSSDMKKGHLKALLLRANGVEAKFLVKILTKEMRIGLVDGLVEEAIAKAYDTDRASVRETALLLGDIGLLAKRARLGELSGVRLELMRPTNFMLAEPMQTAEEIAAYFEGRPLDGEYKYDGVRAQVHKKGEKVKIFSRRLEEITASFPEVVEAARSIAYDFILDGEIVPFSKGSPLPFQLLQRRLRRIENFEAAMREAPVLYFCFDILLLDGEDLHQRPLRERREALGRIAAGAFREASMKKVSTGEEVEALFRLSRTSGYEGLVLKDPESPYTPGKRGKSWVKLKEELDTLDVVIVGAELGHGKRAGKISDYTFAVRDGESLKVIGKAYSGLTDKEIEDMMVKIKALTIEDDGYFRTVKPQLVIEVAFDSIQRSGRHDSGFALRFPRIKRIREDKGLGDIDNIQEVKKVFESQRVKVDEERR
ncbi:MAG: ATP-dependent DNA ligase [Thaumarchaeota archaeon]|nr:ATP-dependent DNA ligase [Nitrososphaerota archaeon]